jgi:DNA helicase-2/ATP-dependent DNA helicase PcrA
VAGSDSDRVTFLQVLRCVAHNELFDIPEPLLPFVEDDASLFEEDDAEQTGILASWRQFLESPFSQIANYKKYVTDEIGFDTHHGVKGLEFKRVMVLLDDSESRGFMYSYERLLGVVPLSKTDIKNIQEGKDSAISRTLRLLYVTCTRAEDSLAVLAYSENPNKLREYVIAKGWFANDEVIAL